MRAYLASSIAVTCAAVLALPLSLATPAVAALPPTTPTTPTTPGAQGATRTDATERPEVMRPDADVAVRPEADAAVRPDADVSVRPDADVAGSTQSLPLAPLRDGRRAIGPSGASGGAQGLTRRDVRPFSLVGLVWDDPRAHLHGMVQVRTRAAGTAEWSEWQDLEVHNDEHGADPGTEEDSSGALRGSTAPLWVGDSDGVEIRVQPEGPADAAAPPAEPLPTGLRLELVDPGEERPAQGPPRTRVAGVTHGASIARRGPTVEESAAFSVNARSAPVGTAVIPAAAAAKPYIGPRPKIITRKGWGANEKLREKGFKYTKSIKAAFVHHSATGNKYTCKQAPSVLRSIYRYHTQSSGWRDFGYNFAVDKCGNIYEGRAGGVAKPVLGAHTLGFNTNSMGIAVLGTYSSTNPPAAVTTAIARLTAWKLGLHGGNPKGKATLTSGGGNRYKKGKKVKFNAIAGHRDGYATACPGARLYGKLGATRSASAKYQGRR
ncbi:peptidoglycan recognition protein [Streptomyces sp. P9(2023)]|uniref:peptidoglycan recognition protein family protein n=1 Tax=Streptomyces sp. P9(2023) TaxID=3064394 RepID=UPI0028F418A1|nr:peptidoglycan recognition protein [Streptomyces sp. P9(2023)]MDT9691219.1 peptidoglycan recognition protein [Streptomyces sp. P9(2023)]